MICAFSTTTTTSTTPTPATPYNQDQFDDIKKQLTDLVANSSWVEEKFNFGKISDRAVGAAEFASKHENRS